MSVKISLHSKHGTSLADYNNVFSIRLLSGGPLCGPPMNERSFQSNKNNVCSFQGVKLKGAQASALTENNRPAS